MTVTWELETQTIPNFFDNNRAKFFEGMFLENNHYICDLFNQGFKFHYTTGRLKQVIEYQPTDFYCALKNVNETDRIIYIELPKPKISDFSYNFYAKYYFIPYRIKNNTIEIFDMFGIDTVKDTDLGFIIRYKDAQHLMSNLKLPVDINNRADIVDFMSEYIFDRI